MDQKKNLLLVHGKDRTGDIRFCRYNSQTKQYDITFSSGETYSYRYSSVIRDKDPQALNPALYQISRNGITFRNVQSIFAFCGQGHDEYWHITFSNGTGRTYLRSGLQVAVSCLSEAEAKDCLAYLRALSAISTLRSSEGEILLKKQYDSITFVDRKSALAVYLDPETHSVQKHACGRLIFPFGGNASQFAAVHRALEDQISVIQGPPGTGKTQTILNIIANLLLRGKTVQVVSNNNSATQNVLEKLSSPQCGLGFLAAPLGKSENKEAFLQGQSGRYPDLSSWERPPEEVRRLREKTAVLAQELTEHFEKQARLAQAKQELTALELELRYFKQHCGEFGFVEPDKAPRQNLPSAKVLEILQEYEALLEQDRAIPFWQKIKTTFFHGLFEWRYHKNDISIVITSLQKIFYLIRYRELTQKIKALEAFLGSSGTVRKMEELTCRSMEYLRAALFDRYGGKHERKRFSDDDLWKSPAKVLAEYPIVLSTTFSSRTSLKGAAYDYIIMDEASQVDLATGALALSCAQNAVIVGDRKQLPNVIPDHIKKQAKAVFASYHLPEGYSYSENSFLKSICTVIPAAPQTLLREHYRCHPKIIGFCNQKFYHNELIIMTEDHGEPDALSAFRTVAGSHRRDHMNQRQIDTTVREVLPSFSDTPAGDIGVIAPYRDQVTALSSALAGSGIEIDTVHKFQGREKEVVVLTTVDDEATGFSDDPYLLNVAVSRAKKKLCLVTSGSEQPPDSNLRDLISYIEYNNFAVVDSEIHSIFDLLYQPYTAQRIEFLSKHKSVSAYDSENLMYAALTDLLGRHPDAPLEVICHQSVALLIRNFDRLTPEERRYAGHPGTHVDFLFYNRVSKAPVLAVEVDGFHYHKNGSVQAERDKLKGRIFQKYQIPLLRFPTNGSEELEKIERFLFGRTA